jgi:hypothetical protein
MESPKLALGRLRASLSKNLRIGGTLQAKRLAPNNPIGIEANMKGITIRVLADSLYPEKPPLFI